MEEFKMASLSSQNRSMSFFMKGQAKQVKEEQVIISHRYVGEDGEPVPFVLKAIDTKLIDLLQDQCTIPVIKKGRKVDEKLDTKRFSARIAVETTVFPNFKDPELAKSYGLVDPVEVAQAVLNVGGEYAEWLVQAQRVNGYDEDGLEGLIDDAKNSSSVETKTQSTPTSPSTN